MTSSAMRGVRRGMLLAAAGIGLTAGAARAQDSGEPVPERLPPGAVVQSLDHGPGAELRRNLTTLAENPRSLEALIGAGRAAIGLGDGESAAGFFTRAQEIAPEDPRVKAGLGSAMLLSERPEQALILFAEAVQRGAPEAEIAGDRGLAYDMVGDPRHAQQDYALVLRHRSDPEIERRFALSLAISGQRDAALRVIDAQLRRQDRAAWRTEAFILALTGDAGGAEATARRLMPAANAEAMAPFFARLAYLSPAQKAAAVNFGRFPTDGRPAQTASNVDTRADPGALALAEGGPRARYQAPLAEPVNSAQRRRPGTGDQSAYGGPAQRTAPAAQPYRRSELAQARTPRFSPTPPPDPDDEGNADEEEQPQAEPARQSEGPQPREAPAFTPGGHFTLDSSRSESVPRSPPPVMPSQPGQNAVPGFGAVGQVQSPPVRQFQTIQPLQPSRSDLSEVASTVQGLPRDGGSAAAARPLAPELGLADRQARDAAARAAEERYRSQGSVAASVSGRASLGGARHWVQIAHGAQRAALAVQYRQVHAEAPSLVESHAAWTVADGGTNRLLLGPFDSEEQARAYMAELDRRNIAAILWSSSAAQPVERLQGGGPTAAPLRAHAEPSESRTASSSRSARNRHNEERASAADERPSSRSRSRRGHAGEDSASASDARASSHSRSRRGHQEEDSTSDDRRSRHGRSARDRNADEQSSTTHGRSGHGRGAANDRSAASDRSSSHGRSARDRSDGNSSAHGRTSSLHRRASDDEDSHGLSRSRSGHGRASGGNESHSSSSRSSQERRAAAHDTRTSRGRSGQEQGSASHRRRSH